MKSSLFSRLLARLLPRSLWIGVLFVMMGFISFINPQIVRRLAAEENTRQAAVRRERQAWWQRRKRALGVLNSPRHTLGRSLGSTVIPDILLPEVDDILVFSHGIPVVPWLKRVGIRQWQLWLDHLGETLRARYPDRADIAPGPAWEEWILLHVRYVEVHFARIAGPRIAKLAANLPQGPGGIYLFGHSAGGAAVLQYLADLRDGNVPPPSRPLRAVLTLDAAVTGPSRIWTGWPVAPERPSRLDRFIPKFRRYIRMEQSAKGPKLRWHHHLSWARDYMQLPFRGLGSWAREQGICMLTVSNLADAFSHPILDDLPYLEMHIGKRFDIKSIATGRTHLNVQRDPRVSTFLWWHDEVPVRDVGW